MISNFQMRLIHYDDVIMTTMSSQITSLTVVYSAVYSDSDQRKHQSSASLAFVWGIHRDRWIPRTKGQLRGKCFHLMTSSCNYFLTPLPCLPGASELIHWKLRPLWPRSYIWNTVQILLDNPWYIPWPENVNWQQYPLYNILEMI